MLSIKSATPSRPPDFHGIPIVIGTYECHQIIFPKSSNFLGIFRKGGPGGDVPYLSPHP